VLGWLIERYRDKHIRFKIYRTIIFPVVLYGCRTWSPTLREEVRLRVFVNSVMRKKFGPTRDEVTESGEDYITRSFMIPTTHQILLV